VLIPPDDFSDGLVIAALTKGWGLRCLALSYLPVGWGSHHWDATDDAGVRWFVTVDELNARRWSSTEPLAAARARLEASLRTAVDLAASGLRFVHPPVPSGTGSPLVQLPEASRFAVSLYPFVAGQSFAWGEFSSAEHRLAVVDCIAAIHSAPPEARRHALTDDLTIACRDALESALGQAGRRPEAIQGPPGRQASGPYDEPARALIEDHAAMLRERFRHYDALVASTRASGPEPVLTHGEPHPGNTMLTPGGWLLIDWDTAQISLPERDLWDLDPGDGSVFQAYQQRSDLELRPDALELFRLRWDLTEVALAAARFGEPHGGNTDDQETFALLAKLLDRLARLPNQGTLPRARTRDLIRPIVASY
jgi:hypothetical protein